MGDAATSPVKPVILLLHGAWHLPKHYERLVSALRTEGGYQVHCPEMPSVNDALPPNKTLDDDVRCARSAAMDILQTGKDLAVLMHSYGGVVGTSAVAGLHQAREVNGRTSGRVVSLIYMTAFVPFEDQSLAAMFGGQLPPFLTSNPETKCVDIDDPQHRFYSDLDKTEQDKWTTALVHHPVCCQYEPLKDPVLKHELGPRVAWRDVEKLVYLVAAEDQALPESVQIMMIEKLEKEGGLRSGAVQVETLRSSHSPFLSMPGKVVEMVMKHV
jgi:pimeloyl-ACP methyl ester carboxylesterase